MGSERTLRADDLIALIRALAGSVGEVASAVASHDIDALEKSVAEQQAMAETLSSRFQSIGTAKSMPKDLVTAQQELADAMRMQAALLRRSSRTLRTYLHLLNSNPEHNYVYSAGGN